MAFQPFSGMIKKTLLSLGVVAALGLGYLAVNVATSCKAEAQCICAPCVAPAGYPLAITQMTATTAANITSVTAQYLADLSIKTTNLAQAVISRADMTGKNIVSWFETFLSYNLEPAMKLMARQLSARDAWQTTMFAEFQDAMNLNRANLALMEQQLKSHREVGRVSEGACIAATASGGMVRADSFRRAYNMAAATETALRSSNSVMARTFSSLDAQYAENDNGLISKAHAAPGSAAGMAADMNDRWQHYLQNYCDSMANAKNAGCKKDAPYKNRDLNVAGEIFAKPTIDVTDDKTKMIVDDIIVNIAEPFATDVIPGSMLDEAGGQEAMLARQSYKAKRQAIYDTLYYIVSRRVPSGHAGGAPAAFISEIRNAAGVSPQMVSANPSYHEIMQAVMVDRYRNGNYSIEQIDEADNNLREMVIQKAFMAMQMNDTIELLDRYSMILAARAGDNIVQTNPPGNRASDKDVK